MNEKDVGKMKVGKILMIRYKIDFKVFSYMRKTSFLSRIWGLH